MNRQNKPSRVKKAAGDTTLFSGGGALLGIVLLFVIFRISGGFFGLLGGGNSETTTLDKGFDGLITKIETLKTESVQHDFTVDKGYYVVGFGRADTNIKGAIKPPECQGASCFCVCIDEKCQENDLKSNRGRDCRPLPNYDSIEVQGNIVGNSGGNRFFVAGTGKFLWWKRGEEKTISITLKKDSRKLTIKPALPAVIT